MAVTTALKAAQRRLLNYLYDYGDVPMNWVQRRVDVERSGIEPVFLAGLIEALDDDGEVIDYPGTTALGRATVKLRLTSAGKIWVKDDPTNRLLRLIDRVGTLRLSRAVREAGEDARIIILDHVQQGYLTLHYAGDLRETQFNSHDGRYEFQFADDFRLLSTAKIRTVLGPGR